MDYSNSIFACRVYIPSAVARVAPSRSLRRPFGQAGNHEAGNERLDEYSVDIGVDGICDCGGSDCVFGTTVRWTDLGTVF